MTNIHDCVGRAMSAGLLNKTKGRAAQAAFADLVKRYETIMPSHQAKAAAAADLKEATRRAARTRFHATVNQMQAARRLRHQIETSADPAVALRNLLARSDNADTTSEAVYSLAEAYVEHANGMIREVLNAHAPDVTGRVRRQAGFRNLILEAHGRNTGDAEAKRLAEALGRAQEFLRQAFNAQGGDIGKLTDFGLPHVHDAALMRRAGFDAWAADVERTLDWSKVTDASTGRPFAAAPGQIPSRLDTERFLRDVWEGIVTRGWDDRAPSGQAAGKSLYNQRAEHRVMHFTPEGWLAYAAKYSGTDPFTAMISGLHGLAKDVAEMRVLGPNPRAGLEYAIQVATKRAEQAAAAGGKAEVAMAKRVSSTAKLVKAMLAEQDGSASVPVNESWSRFFSGVRSTIVATKLGAALLSSTTDLATISTAARVMGMNPANVFARTASLMAKHATRETAGRMGYIAATLADAGAAYSRFAGGSLGNGIPERLASFTLRASGLSAWTDFNRIAFRMEFSGFMADNAGKAFPEIDAPLRRMFEARGITAADWDALRDPASLFRAPGGETFLAPSYWLQAQTALPRAEAEGLAMRLSMAMHEQMEFAIPTASLEGRARMLMGAASGSIAGELLRSGLMFKSFALSLTMNQYRRILALPTGMARAQYAAGLFAPLILLGALAVQLKELSKGRDPRPMDDGKFWLAALFQSGGLGIFGDFFSAETNRFGGGIAETLAGPVVGLGSDIIRPVASNVSAAIAGDNTYFGRDAAGFARFNTPVLSSLWYQRLAFDRLVADQLQSFLDPEAELAWRRQEQNRTRNFGNRTWWDRGAAAPSRAPDFANALGGAR